MIEQAHGLTDPVLEAIAGLEHRVVAADGGRLKLEWSTLRSRPTDAVRDLLWWEDDRLLGFLGIYGFNWRHLELTGMVDPDARRRGIAKALLAAALPICRDQDKDRLLMVVPRTSPGGRGFALGAGMTYEHSEHALTLRTRPDGTAGSEISLRRASAADIPSLAKLYLDGFGDAHVDPARLDGEHSRTLMIELTGETIGTIALALEGERSAIYGFVVGAEQRGQGIGREVLRRICQDQFDTGAGHVDLEVEVENDRALGLYTAVGFEPVTTEDYYELRLQAS
jgi:ribosomal protein S18 acetylase RimI-like enzyme